MGTDIHLYVEKKIGQRWQFVEGPEALGYDGRPLGFRSWYCDRNYQLFGLLADVRNGKGFAGCDLGDPVEPIRPLRGLPHDVSATVLKEYTLRVTKEAKKGRTAEGWCTLDDARDWVQRKVSRWVDKRRTCVTHPDWHSATWYTVRELLDYFHRKQAFVLRGQMTFQEYAAFKKSGKTTPDNYVGAIFSRHKAITAAEADTLMDGSIEMRALRALGDYEGCPVTLQWSESYEERCSDFLRVLRGEQLANVGRPEKVRLLMFFDN